MQTSSIPQPEELNQNKLIFVGQPHSSLQLEQRIYKYALLGLLISAMLFLLLGTYTDIDLRIEDYYYNPQLHDFPWRNSWFAFTFAHVWVKQLLVNAGLIMMGVVIVDLLYPLGFISAFVRHRLRLVVLASMLVPFAIRTTKKYSVLHCPWDVDRYGGFAPFIRLLDHVPENMRPGHCFPTGHASTALWLAAFAVFWLPHAPKKALAMFCAGLGMGFCLGWTQQMRGAHFITHTLWAMWVASLVTLILVWMFSGKLFNDT